jgi:hypothetical protein
MGLIMLIIRKYKKSRSDRAYWEYKIVYKDWYSQKTKSKVGRSFKSRKEAEIAAAEMLHYLGHSADQWRY